MVLFFPFLGISFYATSICEGDIVLIFPFYNSYIAQAFSWSMVPAWVSIQAQRDRRIFVLLLWFFSKSLRVCDSNISLFHSGGNSAFGVYVFGNVFLLYFLFAVFEFKEFLVCDFSSLFPLCKFNLFLHYKSNFKNMFLLSIIITFNTFTYFIFNV